MLPLWMAYATLFSAIVAGIAIVGDYVSGIWSLPRRYVWIAALGVVVVVPAALAVRPVKAAIAASDEVQRVHIEWPTTVGAARPRQASVEPRPVIRDWSRPAAAGWGTLSLLLLALLARDFAIVRRRKAGWTRAELDGERVLIGDDVGPAVVGALRSSIVVPSWAVRLDAEDRALMLRHEAEHIRAGDPRVLLAAAIALVLVPWNAALWLIVRRLRLAIEIDCDARVLRALGRPREYGMLLITVGARHSFSLPLAASLAEERPLLERRIVAMTMSRPSRPLLASLPFGLLVAAAGGLIAQTPVPAPLVGSSLNPVARALEARKAPTNVNLATHATATPARDDDAAPVRRDSVKLGEAAEPPISANWVDAPLDVVLDAFGKFTRRTIVETAATRGKLITATVANEPWDSALRRVLSNAGLSMRATADSIIVDAAHASEPIPIDTITAWILVHHQEAFRASGSDLRVTIVVDENDHYVTSELARVVDDRLTTAAIVRDKEIRDVQILKGVAAAAEYGRGAENGVVVVRTKAGLDSIAAAGQPRRRVPAGTVDDQIAVTLGDPIKVNRLTGAPERAPLYIVDGVVVSPRMMGDSMIVVPDGRGRGSSDLLGRLGIDRNSIASVDVLKFPAGKITPDALGVIVVKLKAK